MSSETGMTFMQEETVEKPKLTLAQVREQLKGKKGKRYWRSIDELADTPEFAEAVVVAETACAATGAACCRFSVRPTAQRPAAAAAPSR